MTDTEYDPRCQCSWCEPVGIVGGEVALTGYWRPGLSARDARSID